MPICRDPAIEWAGQKVYLDFLKISYGNPNKLFGQPNNSSPDLLVTNLPTYSFHTLSMNHVDPYFTAISQSRQHRQSVSQSPAHLEKFLALSFRATLAWGCRVIAVLFLLVLVDGTETSANQTWIFFLFSAIWSQGTYCEALGLREERQELPW